MSINETNEELLCFENLTFLELPEIDRQATSFGKTHGKRYDLGWCLQGEGQPRI